MMATVVLDAGALVALDRGDPGVWATVDEAASTAITVLVPVGVLAQAWRGGPRQARLASALKKCRDVPLDGQTARELGVLCGETRTSDVIDASVAVTAARASRRGPVAVLTSDRNDIVLLLDTLDAPAGVVEV